MQKILDAESARRTATALHSNTALPTQHTIGVGHIRGPPIVEPKAYTIAEFCVAHRLSRSSFYVMSNEGIGPKIFRIGTSIRITEESAAAWRAEREAAATKVTEAVA